MNIREIEEVVYRNMDSPACRSALIKAMFERLPLAGSPWPIEAREAWLDAMAAIFFLVYKVPEGK